MRCAVDSLWAGVHITLVEIIAIFSLMDPLLLRLLPVKGPDSLVMLYQRGTNMGGNDGERANSYPIYQDYHGGGADRAR